MKIEASDRTRGIEELAPERHVLFEHDRPVQAFHPELTNLQKQVLDLLGVPPRVFRT